MPLPSRGPSLDPHDPGLQSSERPQLFEVLYRPIVFETPHRVVDPPSWLDHIPFAFWIVDVLRPGVFVELGTHSGNSHAAFAQAIQTLGLPTAAYAVDTWEGDSQAGFYGEDVYTEWAAYHERHFASFSRLVRTTFEDAAQHFPDGSVDLLHVDGCHIYESVVADYERWRPKLSERGVVLFHDINIRERDFGAWRLWDELKAQQLATFEFLHGHGLGVLGVGADLPDPLRWLFSRGSDTPEDVREIRQFFARLGGVISAGFAANEMERRLRAEFAGASAEQAAVHAAALASQTADREAALARHEETARTLRAEAEDRAAKLAEYSTQLSAASSAIDALRDELGAAATALAEGADRLASAKQELADLVEARAGDKRLIEALKPRPAPAPSASATPVRLTRTIVPHRVPLSALRRALRTPVALGLVPRAGRRWRPSSLRLLARRAQFREAQLVVASGLFDEGYYRGRYGDVSRSRMTPLVHYLTTGGLEGRQPHPLFDGEYYLRQSPDVLSAGTNPLVHYLGCGASEGRSPHPLFDVSYYLQTNPDVRHAGFEPLRHFLQFGAAEGRNPNAFFDCARYLGENPDVARAEINPLVHFVTDGWRDGRRPSTRFDVTAYLAAYPDVLEAGRNPLAHYLESGRTEGRPLPGDDADQAPPQPATAAEMPSVVLTVKPLVPVDGDCRTILCLSHVMPFPPRAGNEYRIYRMLCWLQSRGYRVVPIVAPLPGDHVTTEGVRALADKFSNAILCDRDGRVEYVLRDVPDVLGSLAGETTRPVSLILDEQRVRGEHELELLRMDRAFCHDVAITVATRLQQALGPHVLLAEYIWMSRILPLVRPDVVKVIDTIDVFSTKRDKVLRFGIDDLHVHEAEEAKRLAHADLVIAIQDDERQVLQRLMPDQRVVTAGVDFDVVADAGMPAGRKVLYVASGNPMNRKGIADFLRFAWPQVRRDVPDAELLLAGEIGEAVPDGVAGVTRLGKVGDLAPLYREARVVINPAVAGTGLKIKTLEALGHLRPIVTWPSGTDGVSPELAVFCEIVHDWYDFARRVSRLLAAPEPRLFAAADRESIVRLMAPERVYAAMTDALEALLDQRFGDVPRHVVSTDH